MGLGNICHKQFAKGMLFLAIEIGYILFMIQSGIHNLAMFPSLGTQAQVEVWNEKKGVYEYAAGDNSQLLLLYGVATIFLTILFIVVWREAVKSSYQSEVLAKTGKHLNTFNEDIKSLFNQNLHKLLLAFPLSGVLAFTILPLIFMISMAFTNYSKEDDHTVLFDWVGLTNFKKVLSMNDAIGQPYKCIWYFIL
jgi:arabinogalactan oligomer/maltooligosaccharide transport system permease protein